MLVKYTCHSTHSATNLANWVGWNLSLLLPLSVLSLPFQEQLSLFCAKAVIAHIHSAVGQELLGTFSRGQSGRPCLGTMEQQESGWNFLHADRRRRMPLGGASLRRSGKGVHMGRVKEGEEAGVTLRDTF